MKEEKEILEHFAGVVSIFFLHFALLLLCFKIARSAVVISGTCEDYILNFQLTLKHGLDGVCLNASNNSCSFCTISLP